MNHSCASARSSGAISTTALAGLVGLLFCSCAGSGGASPADSRAPGRLDLWAGSYHARSDWDLALDLTPNGQAMIETVWWGVSGTQRLRIPARWSRKGDIVEVRYKDVIDRLRIDGSGNAQLTAQEPIHPRSLIGLTSLWRDAGNPVSAPGGR